MAQTTTTRALFLFIGISTIKWELLESAQLFKINLPKEEAKMEVVRASQVEDDHMKGRTTGFEKEEEKSENNSYRQQIGAADNDSDSFQGDGSAMFSSDDEGGDT